MNKLKFTLGVAALGLLIGVASCKKDSKNSSLHDNFIGTWKYHQVVIDLNGNGTQDATDTATNMDGYDIKLILKSDGTASVTSVFGNTDAGKWSLSSDEKYLISEDSSGKVGSLIVTAPGSTFVVKDTTDGEIQWQTYVKQ